VLYLNDLKTKGVWKIRVDLEDAFPEGEQKEAHNGLWVELREPTSAESSAISSNEQSKMVKLMFDCIVAHNFEESEGKPAKMTAVKEYIQSSTTLTTHIVIEWANNLPLAKKNGETRETSRSSSSTDE